MCCSKKLSASVIETEIEIAIEIAIAIETEIAFETAFVGGLSLRK